MTRAIPPQPHVRYNGQSVLEIILKSHNLKQKILITAITSLLAQHVSANPTGASVIAGNVALQQIGKTLTVTNSPNAIINWQQFNIGAGETTKFIQQSASSAVLNRVTGQDPSSILGTLQSNGRVFLINPNGIVFGAGSQINVARLVASTQNISNVDFLAGKMNFAGNSTAAVINQGVIETPSGGRVYLIAQDVSNSGVIHTPQGEVWLAAGNAVTLVDEASPLMRVTITAPGNGAINVGQMIAEHGVIGLVGKNVTQAGQISTASITNEGGRIILRATDVATVTADSVTDAGQGGNIKVWSDQDALVHGTLRAPDGFIETSGKYLDVAGIKIDAQGGSWLLDPTDIVIGAGNAGATTGGVDPLTYTSIGASSTVAVGTINAVLNSGTSVIMDTTGAGGAGNITLQTGNAISKTGGGDASLTLLAHNNIDIQAGSSITSSVGQLGVNLHANNGASTTGTVTVGGTITTNGGNVDIIGPTGVAINNAINAGSGTITAASSGAGVSIGAGGSLTSVAAGNAVVLTASTAFANNAGSGAISAAGGRWLIYSSDPASDTFGSLSSGNLALWNKTYTGYAPASVVEVGNRYLFANQPTLTVTADNKTKVYGDSVALTSTVTGLVNASTYGGVFTQDAYSGTLALTSSGTALTSGVTGSPYTIMAAAGTFAVPTGYGTTSYVNGALTVTARPISVSANAGQTKIYGDADPALAYTVGLGNLMNGDTLALARTAGENVGGYSMSLTANANYNVTYTGANFGITPAALLYTATAANRVYGDTNPVFSGSVSGFKGADNLANATAGAAAWSSPATSASNVGGYAINGSGLAANNGNYVFTQAVGNATALTITPAPVQVVTTPTPAVEQKDVAIPGAIKANPNPVLNNLLAMADNTIIQVPDRSHVTEGKPVSDAGAEQDAKRPPISSEPPFVSRFTCDR